SRSSVLPPLPAPSAAAAASLAQRLDRPASAPEAAGHRDSVPPERQLAEARALVNSIDGWSVSGCLSVNMKQRTQWVFTSGCTANSPARCGGSEATAVFVNVAMLSGMQSYNLSAEWRRPVLDRYSVALQAFQRPGDLARIQLAEIPPASRPHRPSSQRGVRGRRPGRL
uniref:GTP-bdg_N domain-containing protein n=1 Tax=Macrostomum lignano TaxID=282301 RepID=A0A1I8JE73_9PLAT